MAQPASSNATIWARSRNEQRPDRFQVGQNSSAMITGSVPFRKKPNFSNQGGSAWQKKKQACGTIWFNAISGASLATSWVPR